MKEYTYQHFIITRFNLTLAKFKHDKSGNKIQTEEWLKKRFELFDWFCFPSIANQSNQNFKWLVLFSAQTPDFYKEKIKNYASACSNFVPLFLEDDEIMLTRLGVEISNLLTGNESHLITTRIDNDDAFHEDIVAIIQKQFNGQDDLYLNFDNGLQYDIINNVLCKLSSRDNPFVSRIEKLDGKIFKTVIEKRHDTVYKAGTIKYIKTRPLWLQIIHGGNLANALRLNKLLFSSAAINQFNIKYTITISTANSVKMFLKYGLKRTMKFIRRKFSA